MQIQPPNNVLNASTLKSVPDAAEAKTVASQAASNEAGCAFAHVVQKTLLLHQQDAASVRAARQAIAEGTLETPQAFEAAARNLLHYGI